MSYSFNVRAADKAAAKAKVASEMDKVATQQACHLRDKEQALSAAGTFIDLLDDDPSRDVSVSMSGYLSGQWSGSDVTSISAANVSVGAALVTREVAGA